jgi:DNA-binding YbaB/EbfC family protein
MSDPFGGMGGMLGGLQQQMKAIQAQAERTEVEGIAANGLVRVKMNGAQEVLSVHIDPKAQADKELLEDLVRAAMNDGVRRSKAAAAEHLQAFARSMGLPPGLL